MKTKNRIIRAGAMLFAAAVLVASVSVQTALGHSEPDCRPIPCIPPDATITSATLNLYVTDAGTQDVNVHRITADWVANVVTWNSFGASYNTTVVGSFTPSPGWITVDVASVVQDWVDGTYPNYGLLLEEGLTDYTYYSSSEARSSVRPFLEICFTVSDGETCIVLIEPCSEVADTYIWELYPGENYGNSTSLVTGLRNGGEKQTLIHFEFDICDEDEVGCRFTGGGVDTDMNWDHRTYEDGEMVRNGAGNLPEGIDRAQFGGQAGAHTALPPQPYGEWTHHQQRGPSGRFTFHGGTASAPAGTEIDEIRCSDPGGCSPSGNPPSPAKQLDFDGIGTFRSIGNGNNTPIWEIAGANVTAEGRGNHAFDGTFHWFEVNIDDLGEPGGYNQGAPAGCPDDGFGEKSTVELADCDCPDYYRITIYNGVDAGNVVWENGSIDPDSLLRDPADVIYVFYGYIDGGNLQIHHLTGYDSN